MPRLARSPLTLAVFCASGIGLWQGIGATRLGLGVAEVLSLAVAFASLTAAGIYWRA